MVKAEIIEFFHKGIDTDIKLIFFNNVNQRFISFSTIFFYIALNKS